MAALEISTRHRTVVLLQFTVNQTGTKYTGFRQVVQSSISLEIFHLFSQYLFTLQIQGRF
jgi:hypothetical protein